MSFLDTSNVLLLGHLMSISTSLGLVWFPLLIQMGDITMILGATHFPDIYTPHQIDEDCQIQAAAVLRIRVERCWTPHHSRYVKVGRAMLLP
jgi:multisubunit Na+/H+ antiporter MnhG subunit